MAPKAKIDPTTLADSRAEALNASNVLDSVAVVRWSIDETHVTYQKDDCHTLSLYLSGGETSHRSDRPGETGGPGLLCMMPQDHLTRWDIKGPIEFAHLYFTDAVIRQFGARQLDCDARRIDLMDLTYQQDTGLTGLMARYFRLCEGDSPYPAIFGEQTLYEIFDRLITGYNSYGSKPIAIQGGLSTRHRLRIREYINSNLGMPISVAGLADEINLSPHHFARMFKESFGSTPAQYILSARLAEVKRLLSSRMPLADIALKTGFSHQSHMTMQFRRDTGLTPAAFRKLVRED